MKLQVILDTPLKDVCKNCIMNDNKKYLHNIWVWKRMTKKIICAKGQTWQIYY